MIKTGTIFDAEFHRGISTNSIDVLLKGGEEPTSLYAGSIGLQCRKLSKNEIDTVIQILLIKKERRLRKGDFPYIYDEMLSDLITAYKERYGKQDEKAKDRERHYMLSINQLEELLKERYKFKGIRFDSVTASRKDSCMTKIEVGSEGTLFVSFREVDEDE